MRDSSQQTRGRDDGDEEEGRGKKDIYPPFKPTLLASGDPGRGAIVWAPYHNVGCVVFSITPRPFN